MQGRRPSAEADATDERIVIGSESIVAAAELPAPAGGEPEEDVIQPQQPAEGWAPIGDAGPAGRKSNQGLAAQELTPYLTNRCM